MVQPAFVRTLHGLLEAGGEVHASTDQEGLAREMLFLFEEGGGYENLAGRGRLSPSNALGVETEAEAHYRGRGDAVYYLALRKVTLA